MFPIHFSMENFCGGCEKCERGRVNTREADQPKYKILNRAFFEDVEPLFFELMLYFTSEFTITAYYYHSFYVKRNIS